MTHEVQQFVISVTAEAPPDALFENGANTITRLHILEDKADEECMMYLNKGYKVLKIRIPVFP